MAKWLDFTETDEGIFIDLSQFPKKMATGKMHCRVCKKRVKAFPPSACNGNKRKDRQWIFAPRWLRFSSFCSVCGWMFKRHEVPAAVKRAVVALDGGQCVYCGRPSTTDYPLELDHIVPQILGGEATEENIVQCCYFCNMAKSAKENWQEPRFGRFAATE